MVSINVVDHGLTMVLYTGNGQPCFDIMVKPRSYDHGQPWFKHGLPWFDYDLVTARGLLTGFFIIMICMIHKVNLEVTTAVFVQHGVGKTSLRTSI